MPELVARGRRWTPGRWRGLRSRRRGREPQPL